VKKLPAYNPSIVLKPKTISEAVKILREYGPSARVVAGNTTLYELSKQGALADVDKLVDVSKLNLDQITFENSLLRVGSSVSFSSLAKSDFTTRNPLLALRETSKKITPPQIRNMGTIGGSLCSGIPFYDMPVTLLALDAKLIVANDNGERQLAIDDFFVDYFITALSPEDLLLEIQVRDYPNCGAAFVKLGRTSVDFAVVNVAAKLMLDNDKKSIVEARIALGAVAGTPIRAKRAEESLAGQNASEETIVQAAQVAASDLEPTPSVHASSAYKKKVIPVLVRDALLCALERSQRKESAS